MLIEVTKEDIVYGEKGNCRRCPIARAVSRAFPDQAIEASGYGIYKSFTRIAELSKEARRFMRDFDQGYPVEPFSFTIDDGR